VKEMGFINTVNEDGLVKGPSIPHSGRMGMEPFEFTSNRGGGVALLRRVKRCRATFYEVINEGSKEKMQNLYLFWIIILKTRQAGQGIMTKEDTLDRWPKVSQIST
jgi:hypothetical protein